MLSSVRKLFKIGASSPSSKDRSYPFSPTGSSRGRSGNDFSRNDHLGPSSSHEHSSSNGHYANGHSSTLPSATGYDDAYLLLPRSKCSSPAHPFVKGRPVTDPKVLQLLGATAVDENGIAEWMTPKRGGSSESLPHDESEDDGSFPDIDGVSWPQKSELPPSFEFARPTGQALDDDSDFGDVVLKSDTGTTSSPSRPELDLPHTFPFGQSNRSYGDESYYENGTAPGSGEDSSVDSVDALSRATRTPVQALRLSSPRPSNGYSSPRGSTHSHGEKSWSSNGGRPEVMSWGSTGSPSPRRPNSGQPSPERGNQIPHPLPAPPPSSSAPPPPFSGALIANHGRDPGWTEAYNSGTSRDGKRQSLGYRVPSPSHLRASPRLNSHLTPVMSPHPSPPRSPMRSPRPSFPPIPWAPLPPPPLVLSPASYQSPPKSPSRIPRTLTKWKKIKLIGTGSFGTVHEAINLDDGSFFAVKVSHDESIPAEIQKEIEVLRMLRHPNVVQYFGTAMEFWVVAGEVWTSVRGCCDIDMEDGHLCIFLELMQNSLQSIIKVFHHFDETLISTYTRQILQGLEYLHQKNTIHRDIKCANILVDKDGQVKLADFGLAKEVGLSLATSCKGTPYFMAPEILKPHSNTKRGYGLPVDIWSLGCTVFEMADGQPPWSFSHGFSFFFKLQKGELPPIPQHLSCTCQDFIRKCLQLRPEDRPTASQLLLHPFVANAPATAAAAAFVSPSPAAVFMRSALVEGTQGRSGEENQTRSGLFTSDVQGLDSQHHGPMLQRSHRLDRSLNRSSSNPYTDTREMQESILFDPRSPPSDTTFNYTGKYHRYKPHDIG